MARTRHKGGASFILAFSLLFALPAASAIPNGAVRAWTVRDSVPKNDVVQLIPGDLVAFARPPMRLSSGADVIASVTANPPTVSGGIWTYSYVVANAANSPRGIWSFTLEPVASPLSFSGPTGWQFDAALQHDGQINWFCTDPGTNPPDNGGNVAPSPFDIAPGASATFTFTTPAPPTGSPSTSFYVQGFHEMPVAGEDDNIDSLIALAPTFLEDSFTGTVTGPGSAVGVEPGSAAGSSTLMPARPNPTQSAAAFAFSLDRRYHALLAIYDVAGHLVRSLVDTALPAGTHVLGWDGRDREGRRVLPGTYFYQLSLNGQRVGSRKLVVVQ